MEEWGGGRDGAEERGVGGRQSKGAGSRWSGRRRKEMEEEGEWGKGTQRKMMEGRRRNGGVKWVEFVGNMWVWYICDERLLC